MLAPYLCPELRDNAALEGKPVIHFADNQAANGAAMKAYSGSRDLAALVRRMQVAWSELRVDPWVEYVPSDANLSDWPSRRRVTDLHRAGAATVTFREPDFG